jgi:hypothetical protein
MFRAAGVSTDEFLKETKLDPEELRGSMLLDGPPAHGTA